MKSDPLREQTRLWRLPGLGKLELMHASYVTQRFSRHTHEGFAVGVIEKGALEFDYRGERLIASPGSINLANPGEAHNGHAATETGWTYRMFYMDTDLLRQAASEITGHHRDIPFFQAGVIHDTRLARSICQLHMDMEQQDISLIEQESRMLWMLTQLILRHADPPPALRSVGQEHQAVKRTREYIRAHYDENISIRELARVAHLSPFHFIRVFRDETGLPPHAYLTQIRIAEAKKFLGKGWPVASVAYETGFTDQSHLTRHFKRIVGIPPGRYRNFVQDSCV